MVEYIHNCAGSTVSVGEQVFLTVLNVITNMMWGSAMEDGERESLGAEFRKTAAEMVQLIGKPNLSDFFPSLARFDLQGIVKDMNLLVPRFDGIFEKMIGERMVKDVEGKESESDSKTPFTSTHVKALLLDMVLGGSNTSSNTVEFAMAEMMNKPGVMRKVQEDLEAVVGKDNLVEESHIHKLPYLQAVMKETLRLHPSLPLLMSHCPSETTNVGGYTIPKGSCVFVNVWAIHRDPSIWEKPL
ncbi:putative cytochrome P450 [Medicago truncatula]|uniref:Putative cytochrome P450 n=1 Tax=Medicago truncatula TaxID=3880 RepID=A0A396HFL5_MEDTR|nr:putative cytochrome P450 [Medicago truncatula]